MSDSKRIHSGLILTFFGCLAIASTWPLLPNSFVRLPVGTENGRTVPLFNLWTIGWNVRSVEKGTFYWSSEYWDAPIFFPARNALVMSEAQPFTALLAPIVWATDSLPFAYNSYLWISLTLNGWFAFRLCIRQEVRLFLSIGAGAATVLLPIVHWQIGVLQTVPIWGILWTWDIMLQWCCDKKNGALAACSSAHLMKNGEGQVVGPDFSWKRGVCFGLAIATTMAMSVHHGLFLLLLVALGAIPLFVFGIAWGKLTQIIAEVALGASIAALVVGPLLVRHARVNLHYDFHRESSMIEQLSAYPSYYLRPYGYSLGDILGGRDHYWSMGNGWGMLGLAIAGSLVGLLVPRKRPIILLLGLMGVAAFALSLGTHLTFGGWVPWEFIASVVPGFAQVRNVFRFGYFVQLAIVILAAMGAEHFWGAVSNLQIKAVRLKQLIQVLILGSFVWCVADPWPSRLRVGVVPSFEELSADWVTFLAKQAKGAILILPLADGATARDYEVTAEWMVLGLGARQPMVNGYSGFFPAEHDNLLGQIREQGISSSVLEHIYSLGVRYLVVTPYFSSVRELEKSDRLEEQKGLETARIFRILSNESKESLVHPSGLSLTDSEQ